MFNNRYMPNPINNPLIDSPFVAGSSEGSSGPPGPGRFWISNTENYMIDNHTTFIIFGGAVAVEDWVDNSGNQMIDNNGNNFIFGS